MGMEIGDIRAVEEASDDRAKLAARGEIGIDHFASGIERAERDWPGEDRLRQVVDQVEGLAGLLADEDRMLRAIGRVRGLMLVIEQQRRLTRLQVADLDAIGEARFGIYRVPPDTLSPNASSDSPTRCLKMPGSIP